MDNFDFTKQLLEDKRPDIAEIELTLFENCHLNCSFCHHDKKSTVGLSREEIFSKLDLVEQHVIKMKGRVDVIQINMVGGELFVPKIPSYKISDVATAIAPELEHKLVGIRPGEKLHEEMITQMDAINTVEFEKYFVLYISIKNNGVENR